jgi:hypothetical protein
VTRAVVDRIGLEQGVFVGLLVFGTGLVYLLALTARWVTTGFASLPSPALDVVALTATVLGLQVVFSSFFLSAVGDDAF